MSYSYQDSVTGASGIGYFDFTWTPDSVIYQGNNIIIGGSDLVGNYAIIKFITGGT
jgi:hypothetical protein